MANVSTFTRAAVRAAVDTAITSTTVGAQSLHVTAWTPDLDQAGGLQKKYAVARKIDWVSDGQGVGGGSAGGNADGGRFVVSLMMAIPVNTSKDGNYSDTDSFEEALRKSIYANVTTVSVEVLIADIPDAVLKGSFLEQEITFDVYGWRANA